jgi:hypothetical protein
LQGVVQAALGRLSAAGVAPALVSRLAAAPYTVGPLTGGLLGWTDEADGRVVLSADAAGYGWFLDSVPAAGPRSGGAAPGSSPAAGQMDLLTVVLHEMGHLAGLPDRAGAADGGDLMADTLATGVRRTQALDTLFEFGKGAVDL